MADDFTWSPDWGAIVTVEPHVLSIKFGDGYEQRRLSGINAKPQKWSLGFENRTDTEFGNLRTFLDTNAGITSFTWTPPSETTARRFVCRSWKSTYSQYGGTTLTCEFEEVFE